MLVNWIYSLPISKDTEALKVKELHRQIVLYALKCTTAKRLNDAARKCEVFEEVQTLKEDFLQGSVYILQDYWKAVYSMLKPNCNSCVFYKKCKDLYILKEKACPGFEVSIKRITKKFSITDRDLLFTQNILSEKDKSLIIKKFKDRSIQKQPFTLDEVYKELRPWLLRFIYKKFKFILEYYNYEADDLVNELFLEGQLRALECDTMQDKEHFKNTIKQRIKQRGINLIKKLTAESRNRLVRDEEHYRNKIETLATKQHLDYLSWEEKERRFRNQIDTDYEMRLISLDFESPNSSSEEETNLHEIIANESYESVDSIMASEEKVRELIASIPNTVYKQAMKIISGEYNKDFMHYIKNDNSLTEKQFITRVFEFLNIDREKFKKEVGELMLKTNF